jgi:DNA invertase Pin-like site-specific DNA recombinase
MMTATSRSLAAPPQPPFAFSYIRFSHPNQAKGDSVRRQGEAARAWCDRNGVRLDTSLTLHDLGRSAFTGDHRQNPDRNALAAFLKLVEGGKVRRGSFLLIENLDRLSREDEVPACHLLTGILMAGVKVVQLSPYEMLLTDKSNGWELMRAVMELSRGHGESAIKSERVTAAWRRRRKEARESGAVMTRNLPAWVEQRGGRLCLVPGRAAVVKRIFALAGNGYGQARIVQKLTEEKVSPFGVGGHWSRSYVAIILTDRRAVGEFQPRRWVQHALGEEELQKRRPGDQRARKWVNEPDGDPIPGYFPAAVSEAEWLAARAGAAQRRQRPGRIGRHVNVFAGILKDAHGGSSYVCATRSSRGYEYRVLVTSQSAGGRGPCRGFPYPTFERAVLGMLREVDPREVLGNEAGPDEVAVLEGEQTRLREKMAELEAELLNGQVASVAKVLRQLEGKEGDLAARLAAARQKAAHPLGGTWADAKSLIDALDTAPDPVDARLRLRSALRRLVDGAWVLVVPRGRHRLCAAQVWFADGKCHRDYLIVYRPRRANAAGRTEGEWSAHSTVDVAALGALDLRKPEHARQLEQALLALGLAGA